MFEYEVFDPRIGSIVVSVASYGLAFSRAAVEVMGKPQYVILGFDRKNLVIVVRPVDASEAKKISFGDKAKNGSVRLNNREFVRQLMRFFPDEDKFTNKAIRYLTFWDQALGALMVDLKRPLDMAEEAAGGSSDGARKKAARSAAGHFVGLADICIT